MLQCISCSIMRILFHYFSNLSNVYTYTVIREIFIHVINIFRLILVGQGYPQKYFYTNIYVV